MNQEKLAARVSDFLEERSALDRMEWTAASQLAAELFGDAPTSAQLDVLRRVMFRLAMENGVEVAEFRLPRRGRRLTNPIMIEGSQYALAFSFDGGLSSPSIEYGFRLHATD